MLWLIFLSIMGFVVWMAVDCLSNNVRDKVFWTILIICTGIIGAVIYSVKREKLLIVPEMAVSAPAAAGTLTAPGTVGVQPVGTAAAVSPSLHASKVIKTVGITVGVIVAVGGMLFVGLIIFLMVAFSSYGSSK